MRSSIILFILLIFTLGGCVPVNDPANPRNVEKLTHLRTVDYGNGVYYVEASGSDLGNVLSAFSEKHPGQTITWGVAKVDKDGKAAGYFIHINSAKCAPHLD